MEKLLNILFGLFGKKPDRYFYFYFRSILCLGLIILMASCAAPKRRLIVNPELDQWDGKRWEYVSLFPSKYGYLEESEYDKIEFRKPHEIGYREYKFFHDPRGDIDRTKGYDPTEYTVAPDLALLQNPAHDVQITWIGHATFLIQLGKEYQILADPVLEPIDGIGARLMKYAEPWGIHAQPAVKTADLPFYGESEKNPAKKVNIVAISHDHHDHLNFNTLKQLPADTLFYVPRGLQVEFSSRYHDVTAMDWYTSDTLGELTIHFLPGNHRSGGGPLKRGGQSLWGGWLFEWKNYRVYFAGDTGYSAAFKDMRRRYGKFDICLMPIGAYFQRHWHLAPEDAIDAAQDLGCKTLVPWNWGTWVMSFEHILEPPRRLQYAFEKMQPDGMELCIVKMGETYCEGPSPDKKIDHSLLFAYPITSD
jgi:L-ascorbate metabolism protein UlaG (beta-lactamase superfamily)